jgi:flagellar M-ring protein FliF
VIAALAPVLNRLKPASTGTLAVPAGLRRSALPLLVAAAAITAVVLMFLWRDQSTYKPVFGAHERVPAADMMAVLDAEHIPYRVHPDSGQVMVPESALGRTRMLLAAKGVVAKLPAGLELMDRNDPLGVSQFVQDVRFRRGLEGELAQSIVALDPVDSARVHLAIAKSTSFVVADGEKSSASVVLVLKPGRNLSHEQIAAIINLVAGSVASLDPQRVTLVDQNGDLLSARVDLTEGFEGSGSGNEAARPYEEEARRNARELLAPVLGDDNYKVSVTAEVDSDRVQETREQYGEAPKVTAEAMRQESDHDRVALGIPGSLSSRPVAVPAAPASAPDPSTAQKSATSRQYAYDRSIMQIKHGRGTLQRLSVAVRVNAAAAPGGAKTPWSAEQLAGLERLLRSGLGLSDARGDRLTVAPMPFPHHAAPTVWWQDRDNILDGAQWLAYAVGALLGYLLVLRPLIRTFQKWVASTMAQGARDDALALNEHAQLAHAHGAGAAMGHAGAATLPGPSGRARQGGGVAPLLEDYDLPPAGSPVDVMVDHLKVLASKEPERVAEVVKQWVEGNHGQAR